MIELPIPDDEVDAWRDMLECIYPRRPHGAKDWELQSSEDALRLLRLADKYNVRKAIDAAAGSLLRDAEWVSEQKVSRLLEAWALANRARARELADALFDAIAEHRTASTTSASSARASHSSTYFGNRSRGTTAPPVSEADVRHGVSGLTNDEKEDLLVCLLLISS